MAYNYYYIDTQNTLHITDPNRVTEHQRPYKAKKPDRKVLGTHGLVFDIKGSFDNDWCQHL